MAAVVAGLSGMPAPLQFAAAPQSPLTPAVQVLSAPLGAGPMVISEPLLPSEVTWQLVVGGKVPASTSAAPVRPPLVIVRIPFWNVAAVPLTPARSITAPAENPAMAAANCAGAPTSRVPDPAVNVTVSPLPTAASSSSAAPA